MKQSKASPVLNLTKLLLVPATLWALASTAAAACDDHSSLQVTINAPQVRSLGVTHGLVPISASVQDNSNRSECSNYGYNYTIRIAIDNRYIGYNYATWDTGFAYEGWHTISVDVTDAYSRSGSASLRAYVRNNQISPFVFDAGDYMNRYPDVAAAVGGNPEGALQHWAYYGIAEGRQGNATFNATQYLQLNPDVAAATGNSLVGAIDHYITYGRNEGRRTMGPPPPPPGQAYGAFSLGAGQSTTAGPVTLIMQGDGNLVAYKDGAPVWATSYTASLDGRPTYGRDCSTCVAVFQGDGNLVLYGPTGAFWASGTSGYPNARLYINASAPFVQIFDNRVLFQ